MPTAVYLNVYDLFKGNSLLHIVGLGAYHSGLEVCGREWSYGMLIADPAGESKQQIFPDVSGVYATTPKKARGTNGELLTLRGSFLIGHTFYGERTIALLVEHLQKTYLAKDYSVLHKNCHVFCDELALQLTGNRLPLWINRLALVGECVPCLFPQSEEDLFGFGGTGAHQQSDNHTDVNLQDDVSLNGLDSVYDADDSKDEEETSQRNDEVNDQVESSELMTNQQKQPSHSNDLTDINLDGPKASPLKRGDNLGSQIIDYKQLSTLAA
eukprot:TRINITY_DN14820_c0_g2_i1.p2 TRINITY_DN14820_c0_g2~~TRINITY_DN14820_c0_g2_i1.p2  ORF type:complete len:269 (-),score=56.66 TRINITY_DN14820_c0_g2_i1:1208-2014(-)